MYYYYTTGVGDTRRLITIMAGFITEVELNGTNRLTTTSTRKLVLTKLYTHFFFRGYIILCTKSFYKIILHRVSLSLQSMFN